ncbi:(2Fe-2S) ferredoxin [Bradyrhizobium sp. LM6.11]
MKMRIFVPRDAAAVAVGADDVVRALERVAAQRDLPIEIVRTGSRGLCWLEPMIEVATPGGRIAYGPVGPEDVASVLDSMASNGSHPLRLGAADEIPWLKRQTRLTFARCGVIDPRSLDDYRAHGGYKGLERALSLGSDAILNEVTASGLRGRGGAGFPTGIKWKTVAQAKADRKFIVCNADEGDSGTFADRMIMEGDPFLVIEGMTTAGITVGATRGYIYIRSEYPHAVEAMNAAITAARRGGYLGDKIGGSTYSFDLEVRVGAGAYVCGEETSLLESLEGRRGLVRAKPPLPAHHGLFGKPTVINNVLSFAAIPFILAEGAKAYADFGMGRSRGTMPIQLAGNIRQGGLFETAFRRYARRARRRHRRRHVHGPSRSRGSGRRPARRLLPARAVRYPVRLRGLCRARRPDRPWRYRRVRRQRRHAQAGALRDGILRRRILRQVHTVPDRFDPRRRDHREDHARRARERKSGARRRPLQHHEIRLALRTRRLHALPCAQRIEALPGRFYPGPDHASGRGIGERQCL